MEKDIRFSEKKVDDSWKDQTSKEKGKQTGESKESASPQQKESKKAKVTSKPFLNLLNSLAYQAMMHLGEMPHPETHQTEAHPEASREIIDLLMALKEKTGDNASSEERHFFEAILPQIQLKFSQSV